MEPFGGCTRCPYPSLQRVAGVQHPYWVLNVLAECSVFLLLLEEMAGVRLVLVRARTCFLLLHSIAWGATWSAVTPNLWLLCQLSESG